MKFNLVTKKFRFGFALSFQWLTGIDVYGITNRTYDGFYIPFFDYDRLKLEWIIPELRRFQEDYHLSEILIFESSKEHYHAICFDKLTLRQYLQILNQSSCDKNYQEVPLKYGQKIWSLRISKKEQYPRFINILQPLEKSLYLKSQSHITLINKIHNIIINQENSDKKEQNIYTCKYKV